MDLLCKIICKIQIATNAWKVLSILKYGIL